MFWCSGVSVFLVLVHAAWIWYDLDDDVVAQYGSHTPANRLTKARGLGLQCTSDIGHPCYGQMTPVKSRQFSPCSEGFSLGTLVFLPPLHFDQDRGPT